MARNTTPFLLNLDPSKVDEPVVSNDEFLDSLERVGVWLRVLAAHDSLERYISPDASATQRLAALSNIYLQLGAQCEDQAAVLIAFSVWSHNRDLSLPDLFFRILVTRSKSPPTGSAIAKAHRKLATAGLTRVSVDTKSFFREVAEMTDAEIVPFFLAYRWRDVPSVKLIPERHLKVWKDLPGELRRIARSLSDERQIPRVTAAFNKIKHGPQLVVQNPMDRARRFGNPAAFEEQWTWCQPLDKPSVRLLFSGASTRPEPTSGDSGSVAPFLIDDEGAVRRIFFGTMVYHATFFCQLVKMQIALFRSSRVDWDGLDQGVRKVVEAGARYADGLTSRQGR